MLLQYCLAINVVTINVATCSLFVNNVGQRCLLFFILILIFFIFHFILHFFFHFIFIYIYNFTFVFILFYFIFIIIFLLLLLLLLLSLFIYVVIIIIIIIIIIFVIIIIMYLFFISFLFFRPFWQYSFSYRMFYMYACIILQVKKRLTLRVKFSMNVWNLLGLKYQSWSFYQYTAPYPVKCKRGYSTQHLQAVER